MTTVRQDDISLYVQVNGQRRRPGKVVGHDHVHDMSSGGLKKGNKVKARHISGTPLCRITLDDGRELAWSDHSAFPPEYITIE